MIPDPELFVYLIQWIYTTEAIPKQGLEPRTFPFFISGEATKWKNHVPSSLEKKLQIL